MKISDKHNLYLTQRVWGELKIRAYHERSSASEIVTYLLEGFLKQRPPGLDLARYQTRLPDDGEKRRGRSVYVPSEIWDAVDAQAKNERFSVTGLAEALIKDYLGIAPLGVEPEEQDKQTTDNLIQTGGRTFDLGDRPIRINLRGEKLSKGNKDSQ